MPTKSCVMVVAVIPSINWAQEKILIEDAPPAVCTPATFKNEVAVATPLRRNRAYAPGKTADGNKSKEKVEGEVSESVMNPAVFEEVSVTTFAPTLAVLAISTLGATKCTTRPLTTVEGANVMDASVLDTLKEVGAAKDKTSVPVTTEFKRMAEPVAKENEKNTAIAGKKYKS